MSNWEADFEKAVEVLREGGVLLHETETVFGLACDATNPAAVEKIYSIKKRDTGKPLLVLCADVEMRARYHGSLSDVQQELLDKIEMENSGEATTVIFPKAKALASNLLPPNGSIGIRIPQHSSLQRLIYEAGVPLASTSANLAGRATPKNLTQVKSAIKAEVSTTLTLAPGERSSGNPSKIFLLKDQQIERLR